MNIKFTCPLGNECEEIKEGYIARCMWYTKLIGKDPQSEKDLEEWGCAISWLPVMMTEVAQTNRGQTSAIVQQTSENATSMNIILQLAKESQRVKKIT